MLHYNVLLVIFSFFVSMLFPLAMFFSLFNHFPPLVISPGFAAFYCGFAAFYFFSTLLFCIYLEVNISIRQNSVFLQHNNTTIHCMFFCCCFFNLI